MFIKINLILKNIHYIKILMNKEFANKNKFNVLNILIIQIYY